MNESNTSSTPEIDHINPETTSHTGIPKPVSAPEETTEEVVKPDLSTDKFGEEIPL